MSTSCKLKKKAIAESKPIGQSIESSKNPVCERKKLKTSTDASTDFNAAAPPTATPTTMGSSLSLTTDEAKKIPFQKLAGGGARKRADKPKRKGVDNTGSEEEEYNYIVNDYLSTSPRTSSISRLSTISGISVTGKPKTTIEHTIRRRHLYVFCSIIFGLILSIGLALVIGLPLLFRRLREIDDSLKIIETNGTCSTIDTS